MKLRPVIEGGSRILIGDDNVVGAIAIPPRSIVNNIQVDLDITVNAKIDIDKAVFWGVSGYVVPVLDPDTPITPDAIWDNQIPKDKAVGTGNILDLDTASADTDAEIEPGIPNPSAFAGIGTNPRRLFRTKGRLTYARSPTGFVDDGTPPPQGTYVPRTSKNLRAKGGVKVMQPSIMLIGFSSPLTTKTVTTFYVPASTAEWLELTYAGDTLVDAQKYLTGRFETGAETPYLEALTNQARYLEQFHEPSTGKWVAVDYDVFVTVRASVWVPGRRQPKSLSVE